MKRNVIFVFTLVIGVFLLIACGDSDTKTTTTTTSNYDQAIEYYNEGVILHDTNPDQSMEKYKLSLQNSTDIGEVYLNIGLIYSNRDDYDKGEEYTKTALSTFQRTGKKVSDTQSLERLKSICNNNIGTIYIQRMNSASDEFTMKRHLDTALSYFKKAMDIDSSYLTAIDNYNTFKNYVPKPKEGVNFYNEGVDLLDAKKYKQAIAKFQIAIEKDPSIGEAYLNIGLCNLRTGDYKGTVKWTKEAINTFKKYKKVVGEGQTLQELIAICYLNIGITNILLAQEADGNGDIPTAKAYHKTALENFEKGIAEDPTYAKIKELKSKYKDSYK